MDRRSLLALAGGFLTASLAPEAQPTGSAHQAGVVWGTFPDASQVLFEPLRGGLRDPGYIEGRNLVFQQRWA